MYHDRLKTIIYALSITVLSALLLLSIAPTLHAEVTCRRRNNGMINVQTCVGDEGEDLTQRIQAAISDEAQPGDTVFFPAGQYDVRSLMLESNITIQGVGNSSVIRLVENTQSVLFLASSETNITIRKLRLDGNRDANISEGVARCIKDEEPVDRPHGIRFEGTTDSLIEQMTITNFVYDGIYLGSQTPVTKEGSDRNVVQNNDVTANGRNGISIAHGNDNIIRRNTLERNNLGYMHSNVGTQPCFFFKAGALNIESHSTDNTIARNILFGNLLRDNYVEGIQMIAHELTEDYRQAFGNQIVNNIVTDGGRHGMVLAKAKHLIVRGNVVTSNTNAGITLGAGSGVQDATVCGNEVRDNAVSIVVNGAQSNRILVAGNVSDGPIAEDCKDGTCEEHNVTVIGNITERNGTSEEQALYQMYDALCR